MYKVFRHGIYGWVSLPNSKKTADCACSIDWRISDGFEPKDVLDILYEWLNHMHFRSSVINWIDGVSEVVDDYSCYWLPDNSGIIGLRQQREDK